ncbi:MAG: hypothetical protein ABR589_12940 [Chthoniobacterales bacterium]
MRSPISTAVVGLAAIACASATAADFHAIVEVETGYFFLSVELKRKPEKAGIALAAQISGWSPRSAGSVAAIEPAR